MENQVLQVLKTRRSVRKYQQKQVEESALAAILEAGSYAATGRNKQSPVIVAVQDPATREQLRRMNAAVMGRDDDPFYGAPTVVVVLADRTVHTHVEDGALVLGNMMNAAHALGLGSCWIHRAKQVFDSPEGKELLEKWGLPTHLRGVGNCILGYPACDHPAPAPRKDGRIVKIG